MTDSAEFLYLTTTGWKSGKPHEIEIWYVEHGGSFYLMAEYGEKAHWVQNIRHNPAIHIRVGGIHSDGTGRVVDGEGDSALIAIIQGKMKAKYDWDDALIVELTPQP